ncbi:SemiSWEET transporter [Candidatus Micrarchaeota archaeon]|nr:SemiSWEET transporter [Candidatus Micrarchaeota archaeon]
MDYVQVIGLIAAALTTSAFFPQFWKAYKTKSTKDVSLGMFSLMTLGIFLWLVYGLLVNDLPIMAANLVSVLIAGGILALKLKYK